MYACADGALVCIAANTTRLFRTLFRAIGREEYADDPDLGTNKGRGRQLEVIAVDWDPNGRRVVDQLQELQLPVSRINTIADIVADPQFQARDMIVSIEDDRLDEPLLVPGISPKLSRTPGWFRPLLGRSAPTAAPSENDSGIPGMLPTRRCLRMLPIT